MGGHIGGSNYEGDYRLSPIVIGHSHHGNLVYFSMLGEYRLHFVRMNIFAARADHIVYTSNKFNIAVFELLTYIACVIPSVPDSIRGGIRLIEVAAEHDVGGSMDNQFAFFADIHLVMVIFAEADHPGI